MRSFPCVFLSNGGLGFQGRFQEGGVVFIFEQVSVRGVSRIGEGDFLKLEANGGLFILGGEYVE